MPVGHQQPVPDRDFNEDRQWPSASPKGISLRKDKRGHGGKKGSSANTQTDIEQDPYHSGSFVVDYKTLLQEGMSNVVKITT